MYNGGSPVGAMEHMHTVSCFFAEERIAQRAALRFHVHIVGCVTHSSQLDGLV